jgi:hypothetical protein
MVRDLLVIEVPDASDKGSVTLCLRPIDCFFLSFESAELVVRMVFDYIIVNGRPFRAAFGAGFYINVRHGIFSDPLSFVLLCVSVVGFAFFRSVSSV